jgi:hypothetical protein
VDACRHTTHYKDNKQYHNIESKHHKKSITKRQQSTICSVIMVSVVAAANSNGGNANTVRTNTEQVRDHVPWYNQKGSKTHLEGGLRYYPFFDGKSDSVNSSFTKLVERSYKASGIADMTIVWSEEIEVVALLLASKRLTQIQSNFRAVYRSKLLRCSCLYGSYILSWD